MQLCKTFWNIIVELKVKDKVKVNASNLDDLRKIMVDWKDLPDVIISKVFQFAQDDRGNGRLVCMSWCNAITTEASNRAELRLYGKQVSLQKVHQMFPNLRKLEVQLHHNTEPFALFLWTSLESLTMQTRTRVVNGHEYPAIVLSINTSERRPELMQVYFKSLVPVPSCTEKRPEHTKLDLKKWDCNWELARKEDGFKFKEYYPRDLEHSIFDPNIHQCNKFCHTGFEFGLKGVGPRQQGSIVQQTFGVASKPIDWDAEGELFYAISYKTIPTRLPFFSTCSILACRIYIRPGSNYLSRHDVLGVLINSVMANDATMLLLDLDARHQVFAFSGGKVVQRGGLVDTFFTVECPPLLPEHRGNDGVVRDIERYRIDGKRNREAAKKRKLEERKARNNASLQ